MRILAYRLPELQAQIEKFNKKAAKWGLPPVQVNIISEEVEEREIVVGQAESAAGGVLTEKFEVEVVHLEIVGDIPRIAGWSIHSKVQPSDEIVGQNFVFTTSGHTAVEALRTCKLYCDHCKTNRLKKTGYFIQNKDDGRQMMVGATCLKDFLPSINIESLLAYLDNFTGIGNGLDDEDSDRIPRSAWVYSTMEAVIDAYVAIKKWGFISKSKAAEDEMLTPTSYYINPGRKLRAEMYQGVDQDQVEKELAGFFPHMMEKSNEGNDFIYNIQLALKQDYIKPKMYGYIAAAVNVWLRDMEGDREKAAPKLNEHFGEIGKRYSFKDLKIIRLNKTEGQFGITWIYGLVDEQGRAYTWFGSRWIGDEDQLVNLKATIKAHDEYKGRKQTVLTRCTLVD